MAIIKENLEDAMGREKQSYTQSNNKKVLRYLNVLKFRKVNEEKLEKRQN